MSSFGRSLSLTSKKTDNSAAGMRRKAEIRRNVADALGVPLRVLDCHAGTGMMWRHAWRGAVHYAGCDLRWQIGWTHPTYCAPAERVVRSLDLRAFNIFDIDAYGSPWGLARIVAHRRRLEPGERVGLVVTDGSEMKARLGRVEQHLAALAGVPPVSSGAHAAWPRLMARATNALAGIMGGEVEKMWHAHNGNACHYAGAVVWAPA